ncbi:ribose-phosphate diphosphokinase [Inhella gelatinilytica]|uniref:Ribose-phosphate diphosphokinase n=1 Tax=Inhella gelatinilytica TaxID=2795030 RepID=A0A931IWS0_9BURK|nr:ribose-phosphate diphosphokinase [Inhella gelatinilytica]MBH9551468.1 ribose-phosphate diphosphokinase [Inhella gelatinilytica]
MTAWPRPDVLLAWPDEAPLARALAQVLGCPMHEVEIHRFPDGESRLRLPPHLPPQVVVLRGLQNANARLAELLLVSGGARELGAETLTLIAPYLGYMRQDVAFNPGEVVSQRHFGRVLAQSFEAVVTVDPHLHRVATLAAVLPGRQGLALSAAPLLGLWAAQQRPGALLLAPDGEAEQWVRVAGEAAGLPWAVCTKERQGDREVRIALPDVPWVGRDVVLVDDVASTGRTLAQAARLALAAGAASVSVAVTHALFGGDAEAQVRAAGVQAIWSTDCIAHPTNALSVAPLLAAAFSGEARGLAPLSPG